MDKRKTISSLICLTTVSVLVLTLFTSMSISVPALAAGETVNIWVTTGDQSKLLQPQANVTFAPDSGSVPLTIDVNEATTYQQMDGFGASFTDSSAWLVWNRLTSAQRNTLMNNLFNPSTGIGLSYLRQPIGSTDFALSNYTFDDMPAGQTDPNLNNFSINHDLAYIIPVVQQARSLNPNLKVMITPWSAPAWMKTNGSLLNGGSLNASAYGPYANYFVKTIQAYAAQGIPISALTIQNEPQFAPAYPGMLMSATEQANFIKNNLGPALANAGLSTKIVIFDHNWDTPQYPQNVLSDAAASAYIDGSAWHCYAGTVDAQNTVHNAYPNKNIYFTECSGGAWAPAFAGNLQWDVQNLIIGSTRNWAKTVVKWNMALDTNFGPTNGGCTNCRGVVTINQSTGAVTYEVEYYALGHASKFVVPGAFRISSNTFGAGSIENVAFKNPDGSKAVIVLNSGTASNTFKIRWAGQSFTYSLPAGAVATFKWANCAGCPTATPAPPTATPLPALPRTGWTATASSTEAGSSPANALDGNTSTRWSTGTAQVNGQWFRVDMLTAKTFNQISLDAGSSTGDYPRGYEVYVSNDGTNWGSPVASGTGAAQLINISFAMQTARYLRVVQTGSVGNWWSLHELNVYGTGGGPTATPTRTNTPSGPTNTPTNTQVGPTATPTRTNTPVSATNTPTNTPVGGTIYYRIVNRLSGKVLDVKDNSTANGARIQQWDYAGGLNQQWSRVDVGGGYFKVLARSTGKALDVVDNSTANGAQIQQWDYTGGLNQQWQFIDVGGGYFRIIVRSTGKALDDTNNSTANGTIMQQWDYTGGTNQQWSLVQVP
jgi:glucosylceramidase